MTAPKLVTNPPEGSGLVPSIVDKHYNDLARGVPGEHVVATVVLQPVGTSQSQMTLPVTNNPSEMRANILAALDEWATGENVTQDQLNERWVAHFGGADYAATQEVAKGSLAQLQEFAGTVGAIDDPYADGSTANDAADDSDDSDLDDDADADVEPAAEPTKTATAAKQLAAVPDESPSEDTA